MQKILLVGATSAMAQELARLWATEGAAFYLVGRNDERLRVVSQDLLTRGASNVHCRVLNFDAFDTYESIVGDAFAELDGLNTLIVAHGELTDQARAQTDMNYLIEQLGV